MRYVMKDQIKAKERLKDLLCLGWFGRKLYKFSMPAGF